MTPPRPRTRARSALRLVLLAVLTLATVEVGLRVARPYSPPLRALLWQAALPPDFARITTLPELLATTPLGWSPGVARDGYVLNSRSLPTAEYATTKTPGTIRLLALGDSFTFDRFPMSRHWTTLLARDLEQRTGRPVELIRFGVPGSGPQLQLRLFEIEGARLAPDVVVLAFFVGNDFFDELGGTFAHGPLERAARALRQWSLAWRLGSNVARVATGVVIHDAPGPSPDGLPAGRGGHEVPGYASAFDESAATFTEEAFLDVEAERLSLCRRDATLAATMRLERVTDTIELLDAAVHHAGARLVVMIIPDQFQLDADLLARAAARAGTTVADYDLDWPQRALGAALVARGIPVLDLLPASRQAATTAALYRPRDTHWNSAGNRLAAGALAQLLTGTQLLPATPTAAELSPPRP